MSFRTPVAQGKHVADTVIVGSGIADLSAAMN